MKKHVISALAVATLGLGTGVSAEEIVTAPEKAPESDTQAQSVKPVTEADVKASEDKLTEATSAVNTQKEVVAKAEADKQTAEKAVSTAQDEVSKAETLVKEATPEAIKAVKSDIAKTETALPEADKSIAMAAAEVTKAETVVSDQETVVNTVKADLSAKEEAVAEAKADVDKAQAILDGTNQASVVAEADQAKEALAIAQSDLANAEADLTKAKEADQKRAQAIAEWTDKVETTQADLASKEEVLTRARAKADETGIALAQAQKNLTEAENKVNAINTITFSPEYIQALTDYMEHYSEKGVEAKKILDSIAAEHRAKNQFKPNPADDSIVLDTNNLSEDVLLDLSNFASDLINQIRRAFGKPETVVTPSAIKFADLVTDGYVADDWSWQDVISKGHDEEAIALASRQLGLKDDNQYYENLNSFNISHESLTLSEAKERVYKSLISFMFNGWEYLHAESIAGRYNASTTYLAVDFSARSNTTGTHFLLVDDSHILDASKFDKTALTNPYDSEVIRKVYATAQTAYTQAKEADDKAKADQANAQEAYLASQGELTKASQSLTEAKATPVLTPSAQAKRDEAKVKEQSAQIRHTKAQEALANLSADVKVKQEALAKAKAVLATKTEAKDRVASRLSKEEDKLISLKTVVNDKKVILGQAQSAKTALQARLATQATYLERLRNAPKVLETAQSDLAKAKERLVKAVATLEAEVKTLKDLEAKEADVKGQHAKGVEAYQAVLEARHQAELERQKAAIERAGEVAIPVFDATGKVSTYVSDHQDVRQKAPSASSSTQTKATQSALAKPSQAAKANSLPKTNSQNSWWLSLLGLLTLTNLIIFKTKKENAND